MFERFAHARKRFKSTVSIWQRGQIAFSQGTVNRFELSSNDAIVLYFDKDTNRIGFQVALRDEHGAHRLSFITTGAVISAKSFLNFHGIDFSKTRQFPLTFDEEANLYAIDLNHSKKPVSAATTAPRRAETR